MREPQFRDGARHLRWDELTEVDANHRLVDGQPMTQEQYDVEDWRFEGTYTRSDGKEIPMWRAPLAGLRAYSALRRERQAERREAYRDRIAEEDEFTAYVNALDDAKPKR